MEEELSPEQAERVRRLLAEARHTDPAPADVAARLDRVLAGLADEPSDAATDARESRAGVIPLAQRRRRAGRLLLAAAAVVVGGVAVAQLGPSGGSDELTAGDAGEAADAPALEAPERETNDGVDPEAAAGDPVPGAVADSQMRLTKGPARVVRPGHFVRDARRARTSAVMAYQGQSGAGVDRDEVSAYAAREAGGCEPGAWGGGRYVPVSYGRSGGWLVVRPPVGETQVVDLFLCGDESAVRSATLPFD